MSKPSDARSPRTARCPECKKPYTLRGLPIHRALRHDVRRDGITYRFAPIRANVRTSIPLTASESLLLDHIDELESALGIAP